MATFQAVNTTTLTLPAVDPSRSAEITTPTTPRPNSRFSLEIKSSDDVRIDDASAKTPTRNSFGGLAGQLPLPSSPFTPARELGDPSGKDTPSQAHSRRSSHSMESQDVEMGGGDDDDGPEGADVSDSESVNSDSKQASKKKKGQRFFCTDFPPCHLSFTRSEHLARHIRKHTGERPFQCHCSRRFSRLDNLRQHAQTVHVNEDIPGDSLAATGTRFQRQIRTDRVRPTGNRSRANTLGSNGGHSRGHSRNLSSSSITSNASSISISQSPDTRRRPPPLAMASEGNTRSRLSANLLDIYNPPLMGSPGPQIVEHNSQTNGPTTPTSATFSTTTESPGRFSSTLQSPISSSRPVSWSGAPPTNRRLSIPTTNNPFSGPLGQFPPPYATPLSSTTPSAFSGQTSMYASPTISSFPESRRESIPDADWRRRTWHPGFYSGLRPATSGLGYHQTPDAPGPTFTTQPAASQTTRLPGIESFDHAPPPLPMPRRLPSPMQIDSPPRPISYHTPTEIPSAPRHEKRTSVSWDTTLQRGIHRLEIAGSSAPRESWGRLQNSPGRSDYVRPTTAPNPQFPGQASPMDGLQINQTPYSDATSEFPQPPLTPTRNKRQAWYDGQPTNVIPAPAVRAIQRTSPEDSSSSEEIPTPSNASTDYHPAIVQGNSFVDAHHTGNLPEEQKPAAQGSIMDRPHPLHGQYRPYHTYSLSSGAYRPQRESERRPVSLGPSLTHPPADDMRRLEALVAVATGEQHAIQNRP